MAVGRQAFRAGGSGGGSGAGGGPQDAIPNIAARIASRIEINSRLANPPPRATFQP